VVSVNSTIEMDLTGACNSEYVNGHQFTSTGGQLDFVRGAYASKGGMSFIAFQSSIKDGKISKIVPRLSGPVTTPRTDVHYVVTENGVANLKGLSSTKRAHALIGLADPAFQDGLTTAAKESHLICSSGYPYAQKRLRKCRSFGSLLQNISVGPHVFSADEPGD
jgi:itaconate CoA-transferase